MLTKLKERVQQLLNSEAKAAHTIGLTPNIISIIGFAFSISAAAAYALASTWSWLLLLAVFLILFSGFCDALDGIVARTYNQATAFGGFFDSLLDRYADAIIFSGIIVGGLCDVYLGLAALLGSMLVSYSRARAETIGVKMESVGIAERAERILILTIASVAAFFWLPALNIGVAILAILTNFTVIQRGIHAYSALKKNKATTEN
jgi:archaetidylinositol phosphate synthase